MRNKIEPTGWQTNLTAFGERNNMRPTRLEVFGPNRELDSDFWLEDGLLLAGIDLDMDRGGSASEVRQTGGRVARGSRVREPPQPRYPSTTRGPDPARFSCATPVLHAFQLPASVAGRS